MTSSPGTIRGCWRQHNKKKIAGETDPLRFLVCYKTALRAITITGIIVHIVSHTSEVIVQQLQPPLASPADG